MDMIHDDDANTCFEFLFWTLMIICAHVMIYAWVWSHMLWYFCFIFWTMIQLYVH